LRSLRAGARARDRAHNTYVMCEAPPCKTVAMNIPRCNDSPQHAV